MRQLTREGASWCVHEVDTSNVPGARGRRCLIVESDTVVRRIWSYPPNWCALGDDTLWEILDRTWFVHDAERTLLESRALATRDEMREAAVQYASALKRDGIAPERALVLLKAAVQRAIEVSHCDGDVSTEVLHETVRCCISAYYES
jgi:hypothetical protein